MLSYLILLILLPITYYSITRKTKFKTPPEFDKIEKEINEWLRSGTFQASEESSKKVTKFSYIKRKIDRDALDLMYILSFTEPINMMPSIKGQGTAILPESYLSHEDESIDVIDTDDEIRQLGKLIPLSR